MVRVSFDQHSPDWAATFEREARRIEAALASLRIEVHHVGSTSVPGLRAKPIIGIDVGVPDSTDEAAYLPALVGEDYESTKLALGDREWGTVQDYADAKSAVVEEILGRALAQRES